MASPAASCLSSDLRCFSPVASADRRRAPRQVSVDGRRPPSCKIQKRLVRRRRETNGHRGPLEGPLRPIEGRLSEVIVFVAFSVFGFCGTHHV